MSGFSRVYDLIDYQVIVVDYFVLKGVPKSDQEHVIRLHQESNR